LVFEALVSGKLRLDDTVSTSEYAASMGGSQIFLAPGETMRAEDMIKSVIIASANDAALALAEHIAGSEESFVARMNARAEELGLTGTHFENTNGLDDTVENHVSTARDIAIMSRALIRHEKITQFSSIWMDSIRDGSFGLTNTNRLVRFYPGATGLKTGSTVKAKFCISATAKRDDMTLICVIMASPTRDIRNACAKSLLDYGFSHFALYRHIASDIPPVNVVGGIQNSCNVQAEEFFAVIPKNELSRVVPTIQLPDSCAAPIQEGDILGEVIYRIDEKEFGRSSICAIQTVKKIDFWGLLWRMMSKITLRS